VICLRTVLEKKIKKIKKKKKFTLSMPSLTLNKGVDEFSILNWNLFPLDTPLVVSIFSKIRPLDSSIGEASP
jgi:hypothetical protein